MDVTDLAYIDSTGYNYEDFPSFLSWLTTSYQNIYGEDVYLGSDSQDGQWIGTIAQALYDSAALGAATYNSFSPSSAQGVGLARLVRINGLTKLLASNSTVELVIVGTAYTTLTNCSAIDGLNQVWNLPASVTIPVSGTITVTATAADAGAIGAVADTITGLNTPTVGWQTVNNPAPATPGAAIELDSALRNRQKISTSIPAQTVFDATIGAVSNVAGVTAVAPYENDTDLTDANGLPPHSISLVVQGGTDLAVAQAILDYKTPGTNTYGADSNAMVDSKGVPITINFFRPIQNPIAIQVTLAPLSTWITSNETIIADALSAYIDSLPIGGSIILTKLPGIAYVPGTTAAGSFNISSIRIAPCATGTIIFTGTGTNADTIVVNGLSIELVTGTPSGNQVKIGASSLITAANFYAFLIDSSNADLTVANYSLNENTITITFNVPGPTGDAFTLTKSCSEATLSGSTLSGGALSTADIDLVFNAIATCDPTNNITFIT